MSKSVTKIVLSESRNIPFNLLELSQSNVRRIKCGVSIPELAEDIAARTLLQSLNVRAVLDDAGNETGRYEVPAGGRRFRALELLVAARRMAKDQPVPCVVRVGGNAIEDSYAENLQREPLHPLDQFRAFRDRREAGLSEEDIAARFMVGVGVVRQRLRLAAVSEKLLEIYAEDGMSLDQLMAFTVNSDHARQEQVWEAVAQTHNAQPWSIKRLLTEHSVAASDRRARFVGVEAYEAAGGPIQRDLFATDNGGWFEDVALLDRLLAARLTTEAEALAAEGWKWIEAVVDLPYGFHHGLRKLVGFVAPLTEDEQATLHLRLAEFEQLTAEWQDSDELPDEIDARLTALDAEITELTNRPRQFEPHEVARAGVFVTIGHDGGLVVDRGYVRAEDEAPAEPGEGVPEPVTSGGTTISVGGQPQGEDEDEGDVIRPLPERLVAELTATRTVALRDALAQAPDAAFLALVHALVLSVFRSYETGNCIQIEVKPAHLGNVAPALGNTIWAKAVKERHDAWGERLPVETGDLWDYIATMDPGERFQLVAHCVSLGVNALFEPTNRYNDGRVCAQAVSQRIGSANRLAVAIGHDMARAGWQPTRTGYLDRVTKPRILEAVREARGSEMAELIAHMKKADMAAEAERLLDGTGWLPEPLRLPTTRDDGADGEEAERPDLPAFLANDDETDEQAEHDAVAAE
ncbi:MAG: ParB N-terminal domain-containing protein [Novosphingobium sp.]|nr:ParB N-terminal domain-containing protein [Novosphingobium sp.]